MTLRYVICFFLVGTPAAWAADNAGDYHWVRANDDASCQYRSSRPENKVEATWDGDCEDGKLSGPGTLELRADFEGKPTTLTFEGEMVGGILEGKVRYRSSLGHKFDGIYKNGKPNGAGEFEWPNGQTYAGLYKDSNPHGFGTMTYPKGETYKGRFENGWRAGIGKLTYPSGNFCVGTWEKNVLRDGRGKMSGIVFYCFVRANRTMVFMERSPTE